MYFNSSRTNSSDASVLFSRVVSVNSGNATMQKNIGVVVYMFECAEDG